MSNDQQQMFRGVPTKIDVDLLTKKYGVPEEGAIISRDEIAEVIQAERFSNRFETVYSKWKNMLERDHSILLVSLMDGTVKAATPDERVKEASRMLTNGRRTFGRAIVITYKTDQSRLSEPMVKTANNILSMNERKLRLASFVATTTAEAKEA